VGFRAAATLHQDLVPAIDVAIADEDLHRRGLIAWRSAGGRRLSLIDCVSFELMRELRVDHALTFDRHFADQGFTVGGPVGVKGRRPPPSNTLPLTQVPDSTRTTLP
jgi:predicted nucleic acid-binding protein